MTTNTQHLINAIQRAQQENMTVFQNGGGDGFIVANEHGKAYNISTTEGEIKEVTGCTCPQATTRNVICKHMMKVSLEKNMNIAQLNLIAGE